MYVAQRLGQRRARRRTGDSTPVPRPSTIGIWPRRWITEPGGELDVRHPVAAVAQRRRRAGCSTHIGGFGAPTPRHATGRTRTRHRTTTPTAIHCPQKSTVDIRVSLHPGRVDHPAVEPQRLRVGDPVRGPQPLRVAPVHVPRQRRQRVDDQRRRPGHRRDRRRTRPPGRRRGSDARTGRHRSVPVAGPSPPQPRLLDLPPVGRVQQDVTAVGRPQQVRGDLTQRQTGAGGSGPQRHRRLRAGRTWRPASSPARRVRSRPAGDRRRPCPRSTSTSGTPDWLRRVRGRRPSPCGGTCHTATVCTYRNMHRQRCSEDRRRLDPHAGVRRLPPRHPRRPRRIHRPAVIGRHQPQRPVRSSDAPPTPPTCSASNG